MVRIGNVPLNCLAGDFPRVVVDPGKGPEVLRHASLPFKLMTIHWTKRSRVW